MAPDSDLRIYGAVRGHWRGSGFVISSSNPPPGGNAIIIWGVPSFVCLRYCPNTVVNCQTESQLFPFVGAQAFGSIIGVRLQYVPCHVRRSRVSATVALKFSDDLALTQKVPLAVANMALGKGELIEKHCPLHARLSVGPFGEFLLKPSSLSTNSMLRAKVSQRFSISSYWLRGGTNLQLIAAGTAPAQVDPNAATRSPLTGATALINSSANERSK